MTQRTQRIDITRDIMASGILAIFPPNSEGAKTVLLHLAWRAGSDPAKDNYRSSYQKQKNSAEQIGCSRETYSRRVEYLRKLGILRTQPHTPGRPLLDTKIVEYTELRNIAERFGKHGAPPMKNDNSFSRSRLSRDNRVTRGSHGRVTRGSRQNQKKNHYKRTG